MLSRKIADQTKGLTTQVGSETYEESLDYLLKAVKFIKRIDDEESPKEVYEDYLFEVEENLDAMQARCMNKDAYLCHKCKVPLLTMQKESMRTCPKCGKSDMVIELNASNLNYEEQVEAQSKKPFVYKRISHLHECLNAAQGLQNTNIPEEVFTVVKEELKKNRLDDSLHAVTPDHIKMFLKRRNLPRYFEHAVFILRQIGGNADAITIPSIVRDEIVSRFMQVQKCFERMNFDDRKNLLRYNYICYKILEQLPHGNRYLHLFPLLKSRQKILQHDSVWRQICSDLDWEFKSTM